jgi:5-(carboxyamino)imidazole ribonucleotide synthase
MASQRVGVIGGGQLAWMMAREARKLGIKIIVQTPHPDDPAVSLASDVILAEIDDARATAELAQKCEVITFENEFINLDALQALAQQGVLFYPSLETLSPLLDKYNQRRYLEKIGLPVPKFAAIPPKTEDPVDFLAAQGFNFPLVLKARRHGYDGYGTFIISSKGQLEALWKSLENPSVMGEDLIPFARELAVIAARNQGGEMVIYPVAETQQENQVCHRVIVPADVPSPISREVEQMSHHLLTELEGVGVFGIELFLTAGGKLFVNEVAPRTHNSGHYTLDGCVTSQFAMQLQAVTGLPLGDGSLKSRAAAMVNLLGYEHSHQDYQAQRQQIASLNHVYLHWYGKTESRPGRKLGHVNILSDPAWAQDSLHSVQAKMLETVRQVESLWYSKTQNLKPKT